jgi:hypothetical protein
MTALSRIGVAVAFAVHVAGCAMPGPSTVPSAIVTSPRAKVISPNGIKDTVTIGKSTRTDVIAALGETLVISFDTGYEVWVYRLVNAKSAEFVVLFTPSGIEAKTRIRLEPQPNH